MSRLEQAELQPNAEARRWLTTFVVIGGGFSGVETAGVLTDFLRASLRYYPRIQPDDIRVVLLHGQNRLLPELSASLGEFAGRKMRMHGLDVRLEARASRIDDRAVTLASGEIIPAGTVICTIGTQPNSLVTDSPLPKERGRVKVNEDMSVPGFDGVWALGDCAAVPNKLDGKISPPTAQFADRQARQLARNIASRLQGRGTARVLLQAARSALDYRAQQGRCGDVRHQALRIRGMVALARRVLAQDSDLVAQDALVPRMELGHVLSA